MLLHLVKVSEDKIFSLQLLNLILGKSPISLLQDPEWDMGSHPHLDPTGENNLNRERKVKLSNVQFAEQRMKNVNPIFRNTKSFMFALLSYIENKQLSSNINLSVQRGFKKTGLDGSVKYQMQDYFQVLDNVSGTPR